MSAESWTDLADGAIMFPLGIAIPVILAFMGQRRAALGWIVVIACVWTAMLVLKLAGYTIAAVAPASPFSTIGLVTPSGHVASSASIYGGLIGLLLSRPGTPVVRACLAAVPIAVGIGITRVSLGAHSLAEVVVGGLVGVVGAAGLAVLAGPPIAQRARLPVLAGTFLIVAAFYGHHSTWEEVIRDTAARIAGPRTTPS